MESIPAMEMSSSSRFNWALAVIDAAGYIEGITRLQKYSFLIAKRIKGITNIGFYDDWQPSKYGPFSKQLADDIHLLINQGLVKNEVKPNRYGYNVSMLFPTKGVKSHTTELYNRYPDYYEQIKNIVNMYQGKPLLDVLHDVYYLYPKYSAQSTIKAQVGKKIYESDSYLNPEYDESANE